MHVSIRALLLSWALMGAAGGAAGVVLATKLAEPKLRECAALVETATETLDDLVNCTEGRYWR